MIKQVTNYNEIEPKLNELLKKAVLTNSMPDKTSLEKEIIEGTLWVREFAQGLLLIRRQSTFDRVNWILLKGTEIPEYIPQRTTVMEIPYRDKNTALKELSAQLENFGFKHELTRLRLTFNAPLEKEINSPETVSICESDPYKADQILQMCFSPLTACLPNIEELSTASQNRLLYMRGDGVLHARRKGNVVEIRHLAVAPEQRGRGIAKKLISALLTECTARSYRVWTADNNTAALHIYREFGFYEDGWKSDVRVYRKE